MPQCWWMKPTFFSQSNCFVCFYLDLLCSFLFQCKWVGWNGKRSEMEKQGYLYSSLIRFHGGFFSKYHMEVKSAYTMRHHDVLYSLEKTPFPLSYSINVHSKRGVQWNHGRVTEVICFHYVSLFPRSVETTAVWYCYWIWWKWIGIQKWKYMCLWICQWIWMMLIWE